MITRPLGLAGFAIVFQFGLLKAEQPDPKPDPGTLKEKPITTAKGELGELLRTWWQHGTAAGNVGDFYDNRDGAHSDLNTAPYPQLQRIVYTPEDVKLRRHWAAQTITLPHVVFGNSSTSAPPLLGGSNPRSYYSSPRGLALLYDHYTHNNVYIYPEHRDHDPGRNGKNDGYGDLYPTNTPYLIISEGSSGSDQPFMRAIPFTLAAFRPDVKKKLSETGLLMPTLQMILRSTNKHLKDPREYLTGKAHPTVFEGSWVNDLAMVKMAHAVELDSLPPMVQLNVIEEDQPVAGQDFFERGATEKLADTPAVIARIFRGKDQRRRLVVSADASHDVNKRPLTFTWTILRGDPTRIKIRPLDAANSRAEITVAYHERRPIAPGSPMESNRVDLGVFVHNGVHHSAPGFITFFSLDNESRTYDERGRIVEIGHGMGETALRIDDWGALLDLAGKPGIAGTLLSLKDDKGTLENAQKEYQRVHAEVIKVREELKVRNLAEEKVKLLQKQLAATIKAETDFLDRKWPTAKESLKNLVAHALRAGAQDHQLFRKHPELLADVAKLGPPRKTAIETARQRLVHLGLVDKDGWEIRPLRPGNTPTEERLTAYEKMELEKFRLAVLTHQVLPGVAQSSYQMNYVDPRLAAPNGWRDVYHYDGLDHYLGWTRYDGKSVTPFNPDGFIILEKDKLGRCSKARTVHYVQDPPAGKVGPNWSLLRHVIADEIVIYEYASAADFKGKIKSRQLAEK